MRSFTLRAWLVAGALVAGLCPTAPWLAPAASADTPPARAEEAAGLARFTAQTEEPVRPWIVELDAAPGFHLTAGATAVDGEAVGLTTALAHHARDAFALQDDTLARARAAGIRALLRVRDVKQPDGSRQRVEYRFHYLLHGFVAYLPDSHVERLRALPGVRAVTPPARGQLWLDNSVDYMLGSAATISSRRLSVYSLSEELGPLESGDSGYDSDHPEETDWNRANGFEGQGMYLAVIDSGLEYTHPMFGGSGSQATTATPQMGGAAGAAPSDADNRKVVYFYNLGGAATLDDFGHGTHVASTAAGYVVDPSTVPGTPGTPGAPPNGATIHGVAPQAKILGYPVCNVAGNCAGDIELAIEDAASPVSLTGTGDGGSIPTIIEKPVADVINLSLGGGNSPEAASSRVSNNAVLAGVTVVAAAGNDGPGAQTLGAPCVGTLVTCVAAVQDPGSIAGGDVLAAGSLLAETCAGDTDCAVPGPPEETGALSDANLADGPEGLKLFYMAGGGAIPDGSVSAHYVFVDRDQSTVPVSVGNRVAVLKGGTGTFFQIVNPVAANAPPPAAILLITDTTAATAVAVVNGVPTFTISEEDGDTLLDLLLSGDDDSGDPPHGAVSEQPMRVAQAISLAGFDGAMGDFSSRGPNSAPAARYRTMKPDVAAPGVGVLAATTTTGNPDDAIGMANPSGYTSTSGTSMATPHVAGAALLTRQYLRDLGFDSTDPMAVGYRDLRFEATQLTRALLMNNATNLRSGLGAADSAPPPETLNDMGAGLIDLAATLDADAVMWGPVTVFDEDPDEYSPFGAVGPGDLEVMIPSHSFGNMPVVGVETLRSDSHTVTIRDISLFVAANPGSGTYDLTVEDVRLPASGFTVSFRNLSQFNISSLTVPADGEASFLVRVVADGSLLDLDGEEIMWYVVATHRATGNRLRMPFYYRAVKPVIPGLGAPDHREPLDTEQPGTTPCPTDTDGNFRLHWQYSRPAGGGEYPTDFRVQEATFDTAVFTDDAGEALTLGSNSTWTGSEQWTSQVDPDTTSLAYFIPDTAEQDEALTLEPPVAVPAGGASLSFHVNQDTEEGFDFFHVEVAKDGGSFQSLGAFSGQFIGTRSFDISPFSGGDVQVRFRMVSDLAVSAPGVYVDDVVISANDFATVATVQADEADSDFTHTVGEPDEGEHLYRIVGLFDTDQGPVQGPASETRCVEVDLACTENVTLSSVTYTTDRVETACAVLTADPDVVIGSGTEVTFIAGQSIVLGDGFTVESGADFEARMEVTVPP